MLPMNVYPGTILKVFFLIFRGFFNLNCTFSKIDNLKYRYIIIFFCLVNTCLLKVKTTDLIRSKFYGNLQKKFFSIGNDQ